MGSSEDPCDEVEQLFSHSKPDVVDTDTRLTLFEFFVWDSVEVELFDDLSFAHSGALFEELLLFCSTGCEESLTTKRCPRFASHDQPFMSLILVGVRVYCASMCPVSMLMTSNVVPG